MKLTGETENKVANTDTTEDKKTIYELTDEDLEGISGGAYRSSAEQKRYKCPVCIYTFPVSYYQVVIDQKVTCPFCATTIVFPKKESTAALLAAKGLFETNPTKN